MADIQHLEPKKPGTLFRSQATFIVGSAAILVWASMAGAELWSGQLAPVTSPGQLIAAGLIAGIGFTVAAQAILADLRQRRAARREDGRLLAAREELNHRVERLKATIADNIDHRDGAS